MEEYQAQGFERSEPSELIIIGSVEFKIISSRRRAPDSGLLFFADGYPLLCGVREGYRLNFVRNALFIKHFLYFAHAIKNEYVKI